MNCKPGDLAYHTGGIRGSKSRNLGKVVRVLRFLGRVPGWSGVRWEVDGLIYLANGAMVRHANDKYLRPIRPGGITDEEVRELYSPKQTEAA